MEGANRNPAVSPLFLKAESTTGQFLCVDETKRPRANSDPLGLGPFLSSNLPEITVTGDDGQDFGCDADSLGDSFLVPPRPRPRSNTCPEDFFYSRKGRPATPPPMDLKNPSGKRFSFNFNARDLNGISFAHHKLSKVNEDLCELQQQQKDVSSRSHVRARRLSNSAMAILDETEADADDLEVTALTSSERSAASTSSSHSHSTQLVSSQHSQEDRLNTAFSRVSLDTGKEGCSTTNNNEKGVGHLATRDARDNPRLQAF